MGDFRSAQMLKSPATTSLPLACPDGQHVVAGHLPKISLWMASSV